MLEIRRIWALRGPNIWADYPVLELELELGDLRDRSSDEIPGFNERLKTWLPSLIEHRCSVGERGGFFQRLERGTYMAHILEHVTLELQTLAGSPVGFGRARETKVDGVYRVAIEFDEEPLARACLTAARTLLLAAVEGAPFDVAAELGRLRGLCQEVRLGPSTAAIARAARARGIPVRRLNADNLLQLGWGARQRRVWTAETDRTGAIAEAIAQDKELTRALLHAVGVPVPEGRAVESADDAWALAQELPRPVVIKPRYGNHGRGVTANLRTREQVERAYAAARDEGSSIICERHVQGRDHRLLVVGERLVAAALREPAQVVGDGRSTIRELIARVNLDPRRSDGHATSLSLIKLDAIALAVLAEQGLDADAIPSAGSKVLLRRNANLSTGGTATDVTGQVHPEVAARAVDAARVVGLDIAGVDILAEDIARPLKAQGGAVVEVNAGPGLRMHLEPSVGGPQPVGEAIVDLLFPPGEDGRIPVIAVTGVNGKTTTTRLIAHILRGGGALVAMATTDGLYVGERRIDPRDCAGPQSARAALLHPGVEAAVLETARGGILREGLGFDRCRVGVVTNIGQGDHLGLRGVETLEDLARVKRCVVEAVPRTGTVVLNALDPLVAEMAARCRGTLCWFARDPETPIVQEHRARGGRAVLAKDGFIRLASGADEEDLVALRELPMTLGGRIGFQIENALAATAAAWALDLPLSQIRAGLKDFLSEPDQCPGRWNLFHVGEATVVLDYAHNPSALEALLAALDNLPAQRRLAVFAGCDREDPTVVETGRLLGDGFDRVTLVEDKGFRDRVDGELNALLRQGLGEGGRVSEIADAPDEAAAITAALDALGPGDLLVIGSESLEASLALLQAHLAGPPDPCQSPRSTARG
ncbi:MAG: cyanophycin synthetase [Chromatiaceae bacterium]|jgi:cyanophycin synthetase|nr:cyanophycin synthetase [Chromatiaceae bacterium]